MYKVKNPPNRVVTAVSGIFFTKGASQVNSIFNRTSNTIPISIPANMVAQAGYPNA